ncbi:hypothetical protein L3X38_031705 [Prunus dulcis]|uniref:HPt domain-containing protein n=1 Tax=Prunus dulcis TaxID=3755 RepID=A0AAD4VDQ7_PRUDU|nr:hypothetical protein L3X38_031705 [Prunus dulcis]
MSGTRLEQQLKNFIRSLREQGILDHRFNQMKELENATPGLVMEVITLVLRDGDAGIEELTRNLRQRDINYPKVADLAHKLKGIGSSVGGCRVSAACVELRQASNAKNKQRMDRASGSIAHPPYFDGNNYGAWKAKMKSFLWSLDERVWSTVVHGFPKPTKKIEKGDEETTILKAREEWTTAEVTHSTNNQKGLNALFTAVSSDQFEYISSCDTSKEAWDILQVTHEGTDTVKGAKLQMHTLQFETLMMDENETFSEFYAKLCVIVNACSSLGEKIPEDRVVKKILRSLPQRFQPKITAIEEIRDLNTLKVQELIGSIQTYEMKHLALKKSKTVAFKVVNEEDDGHSNEDCSDEELTILTRRFMNFLKNQDPRSRDSKGINSKNRFVNYTDGYGHISSECANTLKKQKDSKNKAMHITWSDIRLSFMLLRRIHDKLNLRIAASFSILPGADLWHN